MGKLTDLASDITDADRRAGAALNAAIVNEMLPAFLDARKNRSPERLAADAAGVKRQIEDFKNRRVSMPAMKEQDVSKKPTGGKADQLRAMREKAAAELVEAAAAKKKSIEKSKPATPKAAPAKPEAETTEESAMRKTATTTKSKARTAVKSKSTKKGSKVEGVRPGSKLEIIVGLLKRKNGCTTKDVLEATGWPAVSMPQQAKAANLKLVKEKDGSVTRYRAA